MDKILLVICNGLSCFIICTILFQFMNERYKKSYSNRTLYIAAEIAMGITAFYINMLNFAILNLLIWFVGVGVTVYFLYYEDADRPIRRITESEVLVLCMSVCETLGVLLLHCFLQIGGILNIDVVMQYCLEVAFSKIVLIFLYYVLINRLIKRTEAACSREQYIIYGIMFFYSLVNMLVIVQNFRDGQKSYLSAVNMGCIVLADLYLLYYVKMADEKKHYENRVKALEQQAKMQYEYYLAQTEKYNQLSSAYKATRSVVHDTKKHLFYIKDCIKNNTLDNIDNYIDTSVADIENSYSRINTGNLVIDAFISNYINMAKAEGIQLNTNIKINAKTIPVKDYDLCIIIGNLMDNSFNAVRKITNANSRHINIDLYTDDFQFVVHVKNTRVAVDAEKEKKIDPNEYYHGYGITNIINTSDKYKGVYSCYTESEIFETIIIYPIITDTELRRKLNIPENF